ncbi:hypothetical protein [Bradyrhizobium sp. USDA 4353]
MSERFLIDECLSGALVGIAKARGYEADYVTHLGKSGWQDWNLVRSEQMDLFQKALDLYAARNADLVNMLIEVARDGSVHIREWSADEHDVSHINDPKWR